MKSLLDVIKNIFWYFIWSMLPSSAFNHLNPFCNANNCHKISAVLPKSLSAALSSSTSVMRPWDRIQFVHTHLVVRTAVSSLSCNVKAGQWVTQSSSESSSRDYDKQNDKQMFLWETNLLLCVWKGGREGGRGVAYKCRVWKAASYEGEPPFSWRKEAQVT